MLRSLVSAITRRGKIPTQIVSPPFRKLLEESRRPTRLTRRIVYFVRVVEERSETIEAASFEGGIEALQVAAYRWL
jgi:hypothetical protein